MDIYVFRNSGSNCYFIVAIHAIINMDSAKHLLISQIADSSDTYNNFKNIITSPVIKTVENFNIHQIDNIDVFKNLLALKNNFFKLSDQQDANECFLHILDQFTKENTTKSYRNIYRHNRNVSPEIFKKSKLHLKEYDAKHGYSPISDLYLGQFIYKKTCPNCNNVEYSFEEFVNIDIIPCNTTLMQGLAECFKEELIELKCDKCNNTHVNSRMFILKQPDILVFTIKRFDSISHNSSVYINDRLHIKNSDGYINYKLKLIVHHIGHHSCGGHYYVTVHNDDNCVKISDMAVSAIDRTKADFSKTAYMIMFEKYTL